MINNIDMNENKILQQISSIFSAFMVVFYIGIGSYFLFFFNLSTIDKSVRVIIGSTFMFYGVYRAFKSYVQIKETFFNKENDRE